jgi:hypothetical protein
MLLKHLQLFRWQSSSSRLFLLLSVFTSPCLAGVESLQATRYSMPPVRIQFQIANDNVDRIELERQLRSIFAIRLSSVFSKALPDIGSLSRCKFDGVLVDTELHEAILGYDEDNNYLPVLLAQLLMDNSQAQFSFYQDTDTVSSESKMSSKVLD